ncbi:MAG TPA: pyridoxamine 5'-phosphate oxidase [Chthoniobacterales bacterium]|nr:pyridoxamine 5'-phosphate oxidase [Chthoniobacterales bacterium]
MTETVEKQPAANAPGEMAQAGDDPTARFRAWLGEATAAGSREPTAMSLATTDATGRPDVRMVLLKDADERGFVFYTNLSSPKAKALRQDSRVALCFYWDVIDKQVRVRGRAQPVDDEQADSYFATRPRLSQIGAWASHQSQPMRGYFELEAQVAKIAVRFGLGEVPRPPFWSGFRVIPEEMEFWTQKPFRRHERILYRRTAEGWRKQWLYP